MQERFLTNFIRSQNNRIYALRCIIKNTKNIRIVDVQWIEMKPSSWCEINEWRKYDTAQMRESSVFHFTGVLTEFFLRLFTFHLGQRMHMPRIDAIASTIGIYDLRMSGTYFRYRVLISYTDLYIKCNRIE